MTASTEDAPWSGWTRSHGPMLIAEIGGNHEGDFGYATHLVDLAVDAGADAVKFQIYYADDLVNERESADRHAHFRRFEFAPEQHIELARRCQAGGVEYLASVWGFEPLEWIDEYLSMYKIGSGDLTSHRILRHFAERRKPMILSTGLSTLAEAVSAVEVVRSVDDFYNDPNHLAVLQCTSIYPLEKADANLRCMDSIAQATGCAPGYSDHTTDGQALRVAAARGAEVLEFHFTDTRDGKEFRDHFVSLTPDELKDLIADLDDLQVLLGNADKRPLTVEIETGHTTSFRRGVYFARDMSVGEVICEEDLTLLRPEHGLAADRLSEAIGARIAVPVQRLDRVVLDELERR